MELTSLSRLCGINLGGLLEIEYAPTDWIDLSTYRRIIKAESYNWQVAIPFESERDWLKLPLIPAQRIWTEQNSIGEFGHVYEQTIQGTIPGMNGEASAQLVEMEGYRYLVKLRDRNNRLFLIGSPDEGLAFTSSAGSGNDNGLNAYSIRFFGQTKRRAYSYNPL